MENCIYNIKTIELSDTIFDTVCDCTYVILCCGENPYRLPSVLKNIQILRPTRYVKLIFNKGYKQCQLSVSVNNDLVNIQKYVFKDALIKGYKRILYLEDDFQLPKQIIEKDVNNICSFIKNNNPCVYGLGNILFPSPTTIFSYHQKPILNTIFGMAHCLFYNNIGMKACYDYFDNFKGDKRTLALDTTLCHIPGIDLYRYYKPLVMQTLPPTENQKHGWKYQTGEYGLTIWLKCVRLLNLHRSVYPGFTILYIIPYVIYILVIFFIILMMRNKWSVKKTI